MAHTSGDRLSALRHAPVWRKPAVGKVKINVDAAYCATTGAAPIGVIAMDDDGLVLSGLAKCFNGNYNVGLAKAMTFHEGIQLAINRNWTDAQVEGDAINTGNELANPTMDMSTIDVQTEYDRQTLRNFKDIKIMYVNRLANTVAHELAHHAIVLGTKIRFGMDSLNFIHDHVLKDAIND
ncbi:hypothetical protein V6N13_046237 [Hibiscus sabdariffa]|uniref:RNase H type-1 domain-containing protein n=1 Tax=Hibiscus sabdariffa TaxID=183260 RepID=A0ABR2D9I9_9ROSI